MRVIFILLLCVTFFNAPEAAAEDKKSPGYELGGSSSEHIPVSTTVTDFLSLKACEELHPDFKGCERELAACAENQSCGAFDDNMNAIQPGAGQ